MENVKGYDKDELQAAWDAARLPAPNEPAVRALELRELVLELPGGLEVRKEGPTWLTGTPKWAASRARRRAATAG